jgi:hypothetical protein
MEAFHQSSECRGLTPSDCDKEILSLARQQPLYGVHQCDAMDSVGQSISLGVCWRGLIVLKGDIIVNTFNWICVRKSFVKKDIFFIEVKANSETCQIGFCLGSKKAAKHFRRLFVDCHAFYMEAPRGRTLPRPISMSHTTVNEDKEVDIHSKSLFRRYSSILPKERDRSLSSLSSLSRYKSVSSSQSASSSSSSGKFDLQLSLPDALCSIRQSSLRRRAVCGDKHLYELPSPLVVARKYLISNSLLSSTITEKEELVCTEGFSFDPKDNQSVFTEVDSLQGTDDDEDYSNCSLGRSTPNGILLPDIDIQQVVRKLSGDEAGKLMYPENFLACELRDTERSYCADLHLLNEQFRGQLVRSQMLSPRQLSDLFGNLSLIHEFNKNFLSQLEQRMEFCDLHPEQYDHRYQIADILRDQMSCIKLYTSYVKNESKILEMVSHLRENPGFNRLCSQFECCETCHRPISELFFRPFQRVVHYQEIIKRLYLHCQEKTDSSDLQEALNHVENALKHMNESTRAAENTRKMIRIQREVMGAKKVLQPGRVLVMEGSLLKMDGKCPQIIHVFLFNDILLYAAKRPGLNGMRLCAQGVLSLTGMTVEESSGSASFKILTPETSLCVTTETVRDKDMWIDALKQSIFACKNNGQKSDNSSPSCQCGSHETVESIDAVKKCTICTNTFSLFRGKSKCSRCCKAVCSKCMTVVCLLEIASKKETVCLSCYSDSIIPALDTFELEKTMSFVGVEEREKRQAIPKLSKISSATVLGVKYAQLVEVSSQVHCCCLSEVALFSKTVR